jgi:hypothetical protein
MSSSSLTSSSPPPSSTSSAFALATTSRMMGRRQRRNAISRATESEDWDDVSSSTPEPPLPSHDDELVCPLASSTIDAQTSARLCINIGELSSQFRVVTCLSGLSADDDDDLQAVLARFTFPTSSRKHRRSGEIVDHSVTAASTLTSDRRCSGGPVRRAWCAHCERGRSSA